MTSEWNERMAKIKTGDFLGTGMRLGPLPRKRRCKDR